MSQDISRLTNQITTLQNQVAALQAIPPLPGRNVVVNGSCMVAQVNGTTLVTPNNGEYPIDNVLFSATQISKFQAQQVTNKLNSLGCPTAIQVSVLSQYAPLSTDYFAVSFPIEGLNFARFSYGTATAMVGSLQFKVNSNVSGTYDGVINAVAGTGYMAFPFSFPVIANTDTLITIPNIPGCTTGTWSTDNTTAAYITFNLGCGSSFRSNGGSAWCQSPSVYGLVGSIDFVNTAGPGGSILAISNVQFEVGPVCTPFERKVYNQELSSCQRYLYAIKTGDGIAGQSYATTTALFSVPFKIPMRIAPTGITATGTMGSNFVRESVTNTNIACTALAFTSAGVNSGNIIATVAAGLVAGKAAILLPNARVVYFTGAQI